MDVSPVVHPIPSLLTRLSLTARTYALKTFSTIIFGTARLLIPTVFSKYAPTYVKAYPTRPNLECRFFVPASYQSGTSLPLYIDIHGGGWVAGDAQLDDKICHYLCNRFNFVVVSLQYSLAPAHTFPAPVDDCIELILAILADTDLPVNHNKVAVGGLSAGGNLVLGAAQDARLQSKIKALVLMYPCTDFSGRFSGDYRDKPAGPDGKGAEKDGLRMILPLCFYSYVQFDQDRTDPRLSPIYADPKVFPKHMYFVCPQYDVLTTETFAMAKKLAGDETLTEEKDWDVNGIRWKYVPNELHAFLEAAWRPEIFGGSDNLPWTQAAGDVLQGVGDWLDGVFTKS